MNGRPANMLSGGEFPILVPQSLGTTTIQWRQFGVSLEAVPIILGNGRVRLELQPEVSERDFTNAVDVNGFTVPGLTTRRVNTQVEMRFGETLMLTGLLSMRKTGQTDQVPFFGELPWIGAAFRRTRFDETETELVIMVTPELVAPLEPGQVPMGGPGFFTDTPTDRELFGMGLLEVPNYGDPCEGGNCGPTGIPHSTGTFVGPPGLIGPPGIAPTPAFPPAPTHLPPSIPGEMLAPPPEPAIPPLGPPLAPPSEAAAGRATTAPQIASPRMTGPQRVNYTRPAPGDSFQPQGFQKPGMAAPTGIQPPRPTRGLIGPNPGLIAPTAGQPPQPARQPGVTSTNPFYTRRPGS